VRSPEGATSAVIDHPDRSLVRLSNGGFEIEAAGQQTIRVEPAGESWRIDGGEELQGWVLRRTASDAAGFVLDDADGRTEAGRTMPLVGTGRETGLRFLLLDDGRLFRIVMRGPREGGFELLGWETPGAYLTARPVAGGWTLAPTAACGGLQNLTTISILFAAEILDAEEPLRPEAT
jgi:hypothetical protein